MHIFVNSFSTKHAPVWRCFCMVQPLHQPFRPKCTNRVLQMHHQNPVVPSESGEHPQNPVCTYSVHMIIFSSFFFLNTYIQKTYVFNFFLKFCYIYIQTLNMRDTNSKLSQHFKTHKTVLKPLDRIAALLR